MPKSVSSFHAKFSVVAISGQPLGVMEARSKGLARNRCKSRLYINDRNLSNNQKGLKMFSLDFTYFTIGLNFMTRTLQSIVPA